MPSLAASERIWSMVLGPEVSRRGTQRLRRRSRVSWIMKRRRAVPTSPAVFFICATYASMFCFVAAVSSSFPIVACRVPHDASVCMRSRRGIEAGERENGREGALGS
eukprot:641868-Rhodomonas_salina.1